MGPQDSSRDSSRESSQRRRVQMHAILICVTLALVAGRIATVINPQGTAAFLSANDRSRWVSVAALVENGTFAIDDLITVKSSTGHRLWDTIDKVRHVGDDGMLHYYSSKPTLLTTLIAGVYALFYSVTGLAMTAHPIYVPRALLMLINVPTMALFLITMMRSIERLDVSDFAKRFCVTAACFGTMLTSFALSLNNHLFAAAATSLTLYLYLKASDRHAEYGSRHQWNRSRSKPSSRTRSSNTARHKGSSRSRGQTGFGTWLLAGVAAAMTVACELPALSMFCLWAVLFAWLTPRSIPGFVVGAAIVTAGIFGTNYWAHQSWKTPYAHRGYGDVITGYDWQEDLTQSDFARAESLRDVLKAKPPFADATNILLRPLTSGGYAAIAEFEAKGTEANGAEANGEIIRQQPFKVEHYPDAKSPASWKLVEWDDWYEYPGSYWRTGKRRGVDLGEPDRGTYLFHATLGHYGLFSLTPIWLLVPTGLAFQCVRGRSEHRRLAASVLLATLVCLAFYVARPEIDRNYGGVSVCFRWMLWFAPLWLFAIAPEVNQLSTRAVGRWFAIALLAGSVFSVATSLDSPWQSPWLYRFASFLGWLG